MNNNNQKFHKVLAILIILIWCAWIIYIIWNNSIKVSYEDTRNISSNYIEDLNKRLENAGYKEKVSKLDIAISDFTVKSGIMNVSDEKTWLTPLSEKDWGMVWFSPREMNLFKPQIKIMRKLAKEDKEYCQMMLSKEDCELK